MRRRLPTPDELRLWADVAKTAAPLGQPVEPPPEAEPEPVPTESVGPHFPDPRVRRDRARQAGRSAPPLAAIDRRTASRLARGVVEIDARIDLHGMTQQAAHGRLIRFLKEAQADGARLVLVITGKGRPATGPDVAAPREERGVLRRAVPLWLAAAEMRPFVVGFGEAAQPHGGAGALYVRIRRIRG